MRANYTTLLSFGSGKLTFPVPPCPKGWTLVTSMYPRVLDSGYNMILEENMAAKKAKPAEDIQRRAIRYTPDIGDYAVLCFSDPDSEFQIDSVGIILNESSTGCAVCIPATRRLKEGDRFVVQVGKMNPQSATIVWRKDLDKDVVKIGIKYDK
jgi:hypothetical protein